MHMGLILGEETLRNEEKKCLAKLKDAKAFSEKTAVKPGEVNISGVLGSKGLERLKKRGVIKETKDGRIYVVCKDKKQC